MVVEVQEAARLYHDGKVTSAIAKWEKIIRDYQHTATWQDLRAVQKDLLDTCALISDWECLVKYTEFLKKARPLGRDLPKELGPLLTEHALNTEDFYYVLLSSAPAAEPAQLRKLLDRFLMQARPITFDSSLIYVKSQLLAARLFLDLDERAEATHCIDRALAVIINSPNAPPFYVARWLIAIIEILIEADESARAVQIYDSSNAFLEQTLPPNGFDRFRLARMRYLMSLLAPDARSIVAPLNEAIVRFGRLELPPTFAATGLRELRVELAALCAIGGDTKCAHLALDTVTPQLRDAKPIEQGRFTSGEAARYVALAAIANMFSGRPVLPAWRSAIDRFLNENDPDSYDEETLSILLFARATDGVLAKSPSAINDLRKAASTRADLFDFVRGESLTSFPLVTIVDRVIAEVTLLVLASNAGHSDEDMDLALRLMGLLNRSFRQRDAEVLARLAAVTSDKERRHLHALQRLHSRSDYAESQYLQAMLSKLMQEGGDLGSKESKRASTSSLHYFAELTALKASIEPEAAATISNDEVDISPIGLSALRDHLQNDEVFVSLAWTFQRLTHICVRKDGTSLHISDPDWAKLDTDARTLKNAFSAQHAPDIKLDSQYPVDAAIRLYKALVAPIEDCLRPGDHLIWAPPAWLLELPVGALLDSVPPREGHGFRLSEGAWLTKRVSISYVSGAAGFIGARGIKAREDPDLPFLGIGDPVLSSKARIDPEKEQKNAITHSGDASTKLRDLWELPETSKELKSIGKILGPDSRILVRDAATENDVRREPLSRYAVLAFATHGLVRNDVKGLGEAALVLTPRRDNASADDGLLTASEIANLNLNARLVVLSACNSANFDVDLFASEVQGLSTAFALAGVPATIASLWPVESTATLGITTRLFLDYARDPARAPAAALRHAVSDFLDNLENPAFAHPRFWAPFIVYGDGGPVLSTSKAPNVYRPRIARLISQSFPHGSEAYTAIPAQNASSVYTTGFADMENDRFRSFVANIGIDGQIRWITQDAQIGVAPVLVPTEYGVLAAGYVSAKNGTEAVTYVYAVRRDGKRLWQKPIKTPESSKTFPIGGVSQTNASGAIIGIEEAVTEKDTSKPQRRISVLSVTESGDVRQRIKVALRDDFGPTSVLMRNVNGMLFVTYQSSIPYAIKPKGGLTDFGLLDLCYAEVHTEMLVFHTGTLQLIANKTFNGLRISDIVAVSDKKIALAGERQMPCSNRVRATVEILDQNFESAPLFTDNDAFSSSAQALTVRPNGTLRVFVRSERTFDAPPPRENEDPSKIAEKFDAFRDEQFQYRLADGSVIDIDESGQVLGQTWLSFGADVWFAKAMETAQGSLAVGAVGGQMLWLQVE
jgi:CHAT domain-containing protein